LRSFYSVLEDSAAELPDKPLFVFPGTRWRSEQETLTYGDLALRSKSAARAIGAHAKSGDRALLLFPTGAEFWEAFMGCLAVGVLAVPINTPNLNRSNEQLSGICQDCQPTVLVTDGKTAELLAKRANNHPWLGKLTVVTSQLWRDDGDTCDVVAATDRTIAFLQYTSGSTARPKGVQISHGNLIANSTMIRDQMGIRTGQDVGVTWLPHCHDMGLVGSYLETLFTKNTTWCLPPEEFALRPERWLQLISEHKAGVCGGPNFAYRVCAERIGEEQLHGIDLSSWRVAYIGAERIRSETLEGFTQRFSPFGFSHRAFFPCYGLGEATLMATGGPAAAAPEIREVDADAFTHNRIEPCRLDANSTVLCGSGRTNDACRVVIVDTKTNDVLPEERIGEVFLAGASVTVGYFHRPELNTELFRELTIDGRREQFLQTGDLGFLSENELFITGRTRELIIVRGRNFYPDDIEQRVGDAHDALLPNGIVAFCADIDGDESLVVVAELQRSALKMESFAAIVAAIRHSVNVTFGINPNEILLLRPAAIPRTSSGKPRRVALRSQLIDGSINCVFRERE
jgi:acyl-CoA synthetase (AMP-forming)/AMP-acid ligase II